MEEERSPTIDKEWFALQVLVDYSDARGARSAMAPFPNLAAMMVGWINCITAAEALVPQISTGDGCQ